MTDTTYQPAKVWMRDKSAGGAFAVSTFGFGPTAKQRRWWANIHGVLFAGNAERSESNDYAGGAVGTGRYCAEYDAWLIHYE